MVREREKGEQLADWLRTAKHAVAFTGAGVSTESGIPDFRSPGGVWAKSQPVFFDDFLNSDDARHEYWRQKAELHTDLSAAEPNVCHQALARWEREGRLRGVVTQNIDGLHQLAGSRNVLELHGTAREISCLGCGERFGADAMVQTFRLSGRVPDCPQCEGRLKHATISFGQPLDSHVLQEATRWSRDADLYVALGSSLVVEPAASLPAIAQQSGAKLVIINRDATPLDGIADLVVPAAIGETISEVERLLG